MSSSNRNDESSKSKFDEAVKKISELEMDNNIAQAELASYKGKYEVLKKFSSEQGIQLDQIRVEKDKKIEELEEKVNTLSEQAQYGEAYKKKYEELKSLRDEMNSL